MRLSAPVEQPSGRETGVAVTYPTDARLQHTKRAAATKQSVVCEYSPAEPAVLICALDARALLAGVREGLTVRTQAPRSAPRLQGERGAVSPEGHAAPQRLWARRPSGRIDRRAGRGAG